MKVPLQSTRILLGTIWMTLRSLGYWLCGICFRTHTIRKCYRHRNGSVIAGPDKGDGSVGTHYIRGYLGLSANSDSSLRLEGGLPQQALQTYLAAKTLQYDGSVLLQRYDSAPILTSSDRTLHQR